MYNPEYLERPYIVVLNKIDLPEVCACDCSFSGLGDQYLVLILVSSMLYI
jgi:hypothetical protein